MGNYVINTSSTAVRFDGTTVTELPHLVPADPITLATGINNAGVICGYSHNANGDSQAVFYVGTTMNLIPYPPDANVNSDFRVYDINDNMVMVGYCWSTVGERTAWYYKDGVTYSLDAKIRAAGLTNLQSASSVNNNNVISGGADDAFSIYTPWTYDIDADVFTVLGKIGTETCSAVVLNDSGQTIGRAKQFPGDSYHAVTYDGSWHVVDGTVTTSQWGEDINNNGRMVGSANTTSNRWMWYSDAPGDGSMIEVDLPGWTRETCSAINEWDWMVGLGRTVSSGTDDRGFIVLPPKGDGDHDGDIQSDDFDEFALAMSGPHGQDGFVTPAEQDLRDFDFPTTDDDIDLVDFAGLQLVFEGS
jgi:probable HAF family extracellular repeat protein